MEKITQNLKYIYGENLVKDGKPSQAVLTISGIIDDEFIDGRTGQKTKGFSVKFSETQKLLGVTGSTVTRQLSSAVGSDDAKAAVGKKICLYAVESKKSATGWAIRIKSAQQ